MRGVSFRGARAAVFIAAACSLSISCVEADPPPSSSLNAARDGIVAGLSSADFPLYMGATAIDAEASEGASWAPIAWAGPAASAPNRYSLVGTMPAPGWMGTKGSGRMVAWAGHEGAWKAESDGRADNDELRVRLIAWLLGGGTRIAFSSGHEEWLNAANFSPFLREKLAGEGVGFATMPGPIDVARLASCDLLVVGNPWGDMTDAELAAIEAWIETGGALLAAGLGWSWVQHRDDPLLASYPFNRLGARLGFRATDGWIRDPDAANGDPDRPSYRLAPLSSRAARAIIVVRPSEGPVARVKALAAADPSPIYVIQGSRVGLSLPNALWASLVDPDAALAALDAVYEAEYALCGNLNPPYGGDVVWIVPSDEQGTSWWMHAGNPVVYVAEAAQAEVIPRLNGEGQPGWGIAHELGHDFHIESCANLFVAEGTGETWPNVFGMRSYHVNGWDWRLQMGSSRLQVGYDYHALASPDFADLKEDPFIFLGCLDLIIARYGWNGMTAFLSAAAADALGGASAGDDAARVAYMVEGLSESYAIDFSPLFAHWGFAISAATFQATDAYAECDIAW
jgi:hypothetical protein